MHLNLRYGKQEWSDHGKKRNPRWWFMYCSWRDHDKRIQWPLTCMVCYCSFQTCFLICLCDNGEKWNWVKGKDIMRQQQLNKTQQPFNMA